MATATATHVTLDRGFGEDKGKRDARAAFERAPACASMIHGVQNGRVVTVVDDIIWSDASDSGDRRVKIDYQISNRSDGDAIVTPRLLTVASATGKLTNATAADELTVLPSGASRPMVSVFEVPPGEYALMVPNGRAESDPPPTWVDGCRFPGPAAASPK